jgi:hypothetical protein
MRKQLFEHIPADQQKLYADVRIEVMSEKDYQAFTKGGSGKAITIIRNGEPVVVLRAGADFAELGSEGPHLLQTRDPEQKAHIAKLDEKNMARWDKLDVDSQFDAYKAKVELEIDAHESMLKSLDARAAEGVPPQKLEGARQKVAANLENLKKRLGEVNAITPEEKLAMVQDPSLKPQYLDKPPRLFAMDPKLSGPPVPVEVEARRGELSRVRNEIAGLEQRAAERAQQAKTLTKDQLAHLDRLRERLDDLYRVKPDEKIEAVEARLFDQRPGETLTEYRDRLKSMGKEVEAQVYEKGHLEIGVRYEELLKKVESDITRTGDIRTELQKLNGEQRKAGADLAAKRKEHEVTGANHGQINQDLGQIQSRIDALNAREKSLRGELKALEERASLYYGDKPWTSVRLVDPGNPSVTLRAMLVGELDATDRLQGVGFDALGNTANARQVKSEAAFNAMLAQKQGQQGIDGIYKRSANGVTELWVSDCKTTGDKSPLAPTGAGDLSKMVSGERQLSTDWITRRLTSSNLDPADVSRIREGLKKPGTVVEITTPGGGKEKVVVRKVYAQTYKDASGVLKTRFFEVLDVSLTEVTIGREIKP